MPGEKIGKEPETLFKIGDYFESVRVFLISQGVDPISTYVSNELGQDISKMEIETFNVYLEKHGEFYHPARVDVEINKKLFSFVLNVAISTPGKSLVKKEFNLLKRLNKKNSPSFIPEVFCQGEMHTKQNGKVSMFLGEWFGGFHEFHISHDPEAGKNKILVWDPDGSFFLSDKKTAKLYRQAAKFLTRYYSIDTFEQILSWHHAAGDFVVSITGNNVDLKLITVRNYASMFRCDKSLGVEDASESILEALLLFLLNMSIRMRLDRLNGVGDITWSDNIAVENCLLGFYQGLKLKYLEGLQMGFADAYFNDYLSRLSRLTLYEISASAVNRLY
ncbi:MAG: hypothetical protein MUP22_12990, partial [Desulfobacterales bacterium]|nr:hypothetical protein [Desulfobacterales bacterium]